MPSKIAVGRPLLGLSQPCKVEVSWYTHRWERQKEKAAQAASPRYTPPPPGPADRVCAALDATAKAWLRTEEDCYPKAVNRKSRLTERQKR